MIAVHLVFYFMSDNHNVVCVCCVSWGGDNGLLKRLAAPGWLGAAVRWVHWTAIISSVPHCSHSCLQLSSPRSPQSALR